MPTIAERRAPKIVRPDSKQRVTLGHLADGVSSYTVEREPNGVLVLSPRVEFPAAEAWLWKNKAALDSVRRGLEQSAKGQTKYRGSFAKYATDED